MSDTPFRSWMTRLCEPEGDRPEWPVLLCSMLQAELSRQQAVPRTYAGKTILISRIQHDYQKASGEKRAVYGLYHRCLEETGGRLTIGDNHYWLLSYEVPNQDNYQMRRTDLLGLNEAGGLAVFECKLGGNTYAPIAAILEGVDYLACLTSEPNFVRLQQEFWVLRNDIEHVPEGFQDVEPTGSAQHSVIVLAPEDYYGLYCRSGRGRGWQDLNTTSWRSSTLRVGFAVAELDQEGFFRRDIHWHD